MNNFRSTMRVTLGVLLALLFFVPGYSLYWIYRTTDSLNDVSDEKRRPLKNMLLCIFIPFYWIYWVHKSMRIIDMLSLQNSIYSNNCTICTIMSVFSKVLPMIIIQQMLNELSNCEIASSSSSDDTQQTLFNVSNGTITQKDKLLIEKLLDSIKQGLCMQGCQKLSDRISLFQAKINRDNLQRKDIDEFICFLMDLQGMASEKVIDRNRCIEVLNKYIISF